MATQLLPQISALLLTDSENQLQFKQQCLTNSDCLSFCCHETLQICKYDDCEGQYFIFTILLLVLFLTLGCVLTVLVLVVCKVHQKYKRQYANEQQFNRILQLQKESQLQKDQQLHVNYHQNNQEMLIQVNLKDQISIENQIKNNYDHEKDNLVESNERCEFYNIKQIDDKGIKFELKEPLIEEDYEQIRRDRLETKLIRLGTTEKFTYEIFDEQD